DLFAVGEYWAPDNIPVMLRYIDTMDGKIALFDAGLHKNLYRASIEGRDFNLACMFNDTIVATRPVHAVTIAGNHDTQPLQLLESPIEEWFKPSAYALILLREQGYPCVFYPDLFGAKY